ncbi:MAG TPA: PilZ domain-containing protein [Patescibacteria group bacterium]|nr:PilZ domain-containing protein [Patescibacteria group bacterium]
MNHQERRASRREIIPSLVYLDLQPNNGGILLNLNASGMRVSAAHPLTAATPVRFSFGLDSSTKIQGTGRIAWIAESGRSAGICFVDLPECSLSQISQWLKSASLTTTAHEADELDRTSTQPIEPKRKACPPSRAPIDPGIGQSAETEKTAAAQPTSEEEFRWTLPAAPEPVQPLSVEESSSAIHSESLTHPLPAAFEPIPQTIPVAPGNTEPATGLNARLPVYTIPGNSLSPVSTPTLASKVIFDELGQFGWGLERDWHVGLGTLLLAGGFAALWQRPPLLMLAIALWIASGLILTNRKQPPQDPKEPRS